MRGEYEDWDCSPKIGHHSRLSGDHALPHGRKREKKNREMKALQEDEFFFSIIARWSFARVEASNFA